MVCFFFLFLFLFISLTLIVTQPNQTKPIKPIEYAGVKTFNVDLATQKVIVETDLPQEKVYETISKTGKQTQFVGQS